MARGLRKQGTPQACDHCGTRDACRFAKPNGRTCIGCRKTQMLANNRRWAEANREKTRELAAAYRKANREKVVAAKAKYAAANKPKISAASRAWYEKNADYAKAKSKAHSSGYLPKKRAEDPESLRRKARSWLARNPGKATEYHRRWSAKHPGAMSHHSRLRRARELAVEATLTLADWTAILSTFNHACAYCLRSDLRLTQDHVIPISKGGPHTAENIVPACTSCNPRKGSRGILSMLRFQE